jgi:hypothetical protein
MRKGGVSEGVRRCERDSRGRTLGEGTCGAGWRGAGGGTRGLLLRLA